ncbi:MAG: helix-turn-helix domain-containing protein [Saprospiraceae bacterium]|nr:helix-turn-helix domain-containing protein [Saprospiraceae bacterium]
MPKPLSMRYRKYKPSLLLKPYVYDYFLWDSEALSVPFEITSPANCYFALIFNYETPYQLFNNIHQGSRLPQSFLSGQSSATYTLRLSGRIGMAGVIFQGSAFQNLFPVPHPLEFLDDRVDLHNFIGTDAARITEQLSEAPSDLDKILVLEKFLLERLKKRRITRSVADEAAQIILDQRGVIRMDDLAKTLCISPRNLRRRFTERMGVSPKYFARLKRFGYVNAMLTIHPSLSWQNFMIDGGFYDQSHLVKDYQEFVGKNPSEQFLYTRQLAEQMLQS